MPDCVRLSILFSKKVNFSMHLQVLDDTHCKWNCMSFNTCMHFNMLKTMAPRRTAMTINKPVCNFSMSFIKKPVCKNSMSFMVSTFFMTAAITAHTAATMAEQVFKLSCVSLTCYY